MISIRHLLKDVVSVTRATHTSDGRGGFTPAWSEVAEVRGRLNPASGEDLDMAGQRRAEASHVVYLDPGTDVRVEDRLVVDGRTFRVLVPRMDPSIAIYRKVICEELQNP